jgi:hypothetical protein
VFAGLNPWQRLDLNSNCQLPHRANDVTHFNGTQLMRKMTSFHLAAGAPRLPVHPMLSKLFVSVRIKTPTAKPLSYCRVSAASVAYRHPETVY